MATYFRPRSYEGFLCRVGRETGQRTLTWKEYGDGFLCELPGNVKLAIEALDYHHFGRLRDQVHSYAPMAPCLVRLILQFPSGESVFTPYSVAQQYPLASLLQNVLQAVDEAARAAFDARAATIFPPLQDDEPTGHAPEPDHLPPPDAGSRDIAATPEATPSV